MLLHPSTYTVETNDLAVAEGYTLRIVVKDDTVTMRLVLAMPIGYCDQVFSYEYMIYDILHMFASTTDGEVALDLPRAVAGTHGIATVIVKWASLVQAIAQAS